MLVFITFFKGFFFYPKHPLLYIFSIESSSDDLANIADISK